MMDVEVWFPNTKRAEFYVIRLDSELAYASLDGLIFRSLCHLTADGHGISQGAGKLRLNECNYNNDWC